jgi:hypothetical protein
MDALSSKLKAYLRNPQKSLDLSGMKLGAEGANEVALVLPQW